MQLGLFSVQVAKRAEGASPFRLLTWNIQRAARERLREQLIWLRSSKADILCLTEVPSQTSSSFLIDELSLEGYRCIISEIPSGSAGALIASRLPLSHLPVPKDFPEPWRIVAATLQTGDDIAVKIISVYAPTIGRFRDNSMQRKLFHSSLSTFISGLLQPSAKPMILLCGDLNVHPETQRPWIRGALRSDCGLLSDLHGLSLDSAHVCSRKEWPPTWFGDHGEEYTFDYILCSPTVLQCCTQFDCHSDPEVRRLSDHAPLVAAFLVKVG